ncbi:CopG family transcriptional regulator [Wenjunlia vitaminophila]|nr:CopG family transcriptional regulator [Wenjunlia vitaminophila]
MAATRKMTVTIRADLLDEIRAEAAERGLSAYVAEALRFERDRDQLREVADWLQEEHGALTEQERTAAFDELGELDAEHERRRAAGKLTGKFAGGSAPEEAGR